MKMVSDDITKNKIIEYRMLYNYLLRSLGLHHKVMFVVDDHRDARVSTPAIDIFPSPVASPVIPF